MKYFVKVDGKEFEVTLNEQEEAITAEVGGKTYPVSYAEVDGLGQYAITLGEDSYAASIEGELGNYSVGVSGQLFQVHLVDEREKAAEALAKPRGGGQEVIRAQMPGVIVKTLAKEGDQVEEGQALLILEAMKMQNEIRAEFPGKITKFHVKATDTVGNGDDLVTIDGGAS